jgi:hypothetical protein
METLKQNSGPFVAVGGAASFLPSSGYHPEHSLSTISRISIAKATPKGGF